MGTIPPEKPRTLDDVILWPNEDEKLTQFKCTKCNCISSMFPDLGNHEKMMEKGWGLVPMYLCIKPNCGCHTGAFPLPRILSRSVTLDEAFGVPNG